MTLLQLEVVDDAFPKMPAPEVPLQLLQHHSGCPAEVVPSVLVYVHTLADVVVMLLPDWVMLMACLSVPLVRSLQLSAITVPSTSV